MINYRCKACLWFDNNHESVILIPAIPGKSHLGFCRKHKPGAIQIKSHYYGIQPVMDGEEFCGEFRKDEGV